MGNLAPHPPRTSCHWASQIRAHKFAGSWTTAKDSTGKMVLGENLFSIQEYSVSGKSIHSLVAAARDVGNTEIEPGEEYRPSNLALVEFPRGL